MALIWADRIKETSYTESTGAITVGGAVTRHATFASVLSTSDTCYGCIEHQSANEWQACLFTLQGDGTLARTTTLGGSNGLSDVSFSAGLKHVYLGLPATVVAALFGLAQVVMASDSVLPNERVLTAGSGISIVDGGAGSTVTIINDSPGVTDHGGLTGLSDDDHTQYALLAGRSGGQTLTGGTGASESITIQSTSHATKGKVLLSSKAEISETVSTSPQLICYGSNSSELSTWAGEIILGNASTHKTVFGRGSNGVTYITNYTDTSAGNIVFTTRASGTPKVSLTLGADGQVGIGTSAPSSTPKLHLSSEAGGGVGSSVYFTTLGYGTWNQELAWSSDNAGGGIVSSKFQFKNYDTGTLVTPLTIHKGNVGVGSGATSPSTSLHAITSDSATSSVTTVATVGHNTSGTPAANYGGSLVLQLQSSTTADANAARITCSWGVATHASREGILSLYATDYGGDRLGVQVTGNGSATELGFYSTTPVIQYATTGTTTGFTAGVGSGVNDDSTFTGNTGSTAYTIGDIVRALKLIGIIAS